MSFDLLPHLNWSRLTVEKRAKRADACLLDGRERLRPLMKHKSSKGDHGRRERPSQGSAELDALFPPTSTRSNCRACWKAFVLFALREEGL